MQTPLTQINMINDKQLDETIPGWRNPIKMEDLSETSVDYIRQDMPENVSDEPMDSTPHPSRIENNETDPKILSSGHVMRQVLKNKITKLQECFEALLAEYRSTQARLEKATKESNEWKTKYEELLKCTKKK